MHLLPCFIRTMFLGLYPSLSPVSSSQRPPFRSFLLPYGCPLLFSPFFPSSQQPPSTLFSVLSLFPAAAFPLFSPFFPSSQQPLSALFSVLSLFPAAAFRSLLRSFPLPGSLPLSFPFFSSSLRLPSALLSVLSFLSAAASALFSILFFFPAAAFRSLLRSFPLPGSRLAYSSLFPGGCFSSPKYLANCFFWHRNMPPRYFL